MNPQQPSPGTQGGQLIPAASAPKQPQRRDSRRDANPRRTSACSAPPRLISCSDSIRRPPVTPGIALRTHQGGDAFAEWRPTLFDNESDERLFHCWAAFLATLGIGALLEPRRPARRGARAEIGGSPRSSVGALPALRPLRSTPPALASRSPGRELQNHTLRNPASAQGFSMRPPRKQLGNV